MTIIKKIRSFVPIVPLVIFIFTIIAAAVHIISGISRPFADFFNRYVSAFLRGALANITDLLPFSLAEYILLCIPIILIVLIVYSIKISIYPNTDDLCDEAKKEAKNNYVRRIVRYFTSLLSVAAFIYSVFVLGFATGYRGSTIEAKLELERRPVSAEELYETAKILRDAVAVELDKVIFEYESRSLMPYSLDELNAKLNDAYENLRKTYDFIPRLRSDIKYVMLSEPMTYTHISGVYTFFTGEANLNINFPDYTLPYTAAHELAHQRGIAREDEANFLAFLVCDASDDPYIRYSGYLNLYEYVASALYRANADYYYELLGTLDKRVRYEMIAYNEFFDKYRESIAADVSSAVNNTYLQSQGQTEGTKSYGRVVDLAVAYFKAKA